MTQEIVAENEFLRVRCSGEFCLESAKANFLLILEAIARYQQNRVLVDVRGLKGNPSTIERFEYSEFAASSLHTIAHGKYLVTRFAYLGEIPLIDSKRFGELVARNRGMNVRAHVTSEMEDALRWLEVDPSAPV